MRFFLCTTKVGHRQERVIYFEAATSSNFFDVGQLPNLSRTSSSYSRHRNLDVSYWCDIHNKQKYNQNLHCNTVICHDDI